MKAEELFLTEAKKDKTLAVIVMGNPRFITNNPKAKRYYNDIKKYLKRSGIDKVEFDPGKDFTKPRKDADLVIGHSKGVDRLRFVDPSTPTLSFGVPEGIIHPKDKAWQMNNPAPTPEGVEPPDEHYIFIPDQKMAIDKTVSTIVRNRSPKKEVVIFGENHFKFDEVSRIRQAIVEFNPDVIVHELYWEEESYFKQHLPETKVVPLEKEVGKFDNMKSQFTSRERSMITHLKRYYRKYSRIAVVIGDTHLRTIETEELGDKSPVMGWAKQVGAKIIRSNYKEIR